MRIFLFIVVGLAVFLLLLKILKGEKSFNWAVGVALATGIVFAAIGTYKGCADGWYSTSIGTQGACSHHGGVQISYNIYGWGGLVVGALIIVLLIRKSFKDNKDGEK